MAARAIWSSDVCTRARREVAAARSSVLAALREAGHELSFVNAGGTGSLESSAAEPVVTEVAAGSGLLSPALFDRYRAFQHRPAGGSHCW